MNIETLHKQDLILFKCISGSRSQGLDVPTSDTDIKGVFLLPVEGFYGLDYIPQVSNDTNDEVYYELGRFIELLSKNNPTALEMLCVAEEFIISKHPVFDLIKPELFLSKLCHNTFAGYAASQIKKAKGLNKKIHNPVEKKRKGVLDFCYLAQDGKSVPLTEWLIANSLQQERCGLAKLDHMRDLYAVYYDALNTLNYSGIVQSLVSNDVSLSSIPKGEKPIAILSFNKDGYSAYCKKYKEYWEWVEKRNDERYKSTLSHGKNYDAKNMMHTFRLLEMAREIAVEQRIIVKRKDRDFYLKVRNGDFDYKDLMKKVEQRVAELERLYSVSGLPEQPNYQEINDLLVKARYCLYQKQQ